jgi:hypothetical protein
VAQFIVFDAMKSRWSVLALSATVWAWILAGSVFLPSSPRPSSPRYRSFTPQSVANQLPKGFSLPQSDADLGVSALALEDLDDDGDLDIVAAESDADGGFSVAIANPSTPAVGIVVWVNDGSGRLTRKTPATSNRLENEPASPSLDKHDGQGTASIQPDASEIVSGYGWLTGSGLRHRPAFVAVFPSVTRARLRSRSPPIVS